MSTPQRQYSDEEKAKIRAFVDKCKSNMVWAIAQLVMIVNKQKKLVSFICHGYQEEIIGLLEDPTIRTIYICKYRQAGISTLIIAWIMVRMRLYRNVEAMTFNKDDNDTAALFLRAHTIDEHLPIEFQGPKGTDQAKAIHYEDLNCLYRIDTVGNTTRTSNKKGRSVSPSILHFTEPWHMETLGTALQGAGSAVPQDPKDGKIILESTSAGPQGAMHGLTQNIRTKGKEVRPGEFWRLGDTVVLFLSVLRNPDYRRTPPDEFRLEDDEEIRIAHVGEQMGIPSHDLKSFLTFRRWRINGFASDADNGEGAGLSPEQQFKREFPVTYDDMLESAARSAFNVGIINAEIAYIKALAPYSITKGFLRQETGKVILGEPTIDNRGTIWAAPEFGYLNRYLVFADVAQGMASSDFDSIYVLDRLTMHVVCASHGRYGASRGVPLLLNIAAFYDNAWIAWDMTGPGSEWRPGILSSGYPRIFARRGDMTKPAEYDDAGLIWGRDNKLSALAITRSAIERKTIKIYDIAFFNECNAFGFDEDGKGPKAPNGSNDDRVMSMMGLLYVSSSLPAPVIDKSLDMRAYEPKDRAVQRIEKIRHDAARSILESSNKGLSTWD